MEKDFKQIFLPLASILQNVIIKKDEILIHIIDKWEEIVEKFGKDFLSSAYPNKIFWNHDNKAVLYIKLKNNYLAVMIMQQVNKLIDIINKELGSKVVTKIILLNK
jgi:hypothetical protein